MLLTFADWLVYGVLGFDPGTRIGQAVNFFIYDSVKIILLLFVMIFLIGFLRTFIPQDKVRNLMSRSGGLGYFYAALFGAVTPFCSCSSIPIFITFLKTGIPLGVAFAFLVTGPLINQYLVVLMIGYFGWKVTVLYVASGLFLGVFSGLMIRNAKMEQDLVSDLVDTSDFSQSAGERLSFSLRLRFGLEEAFSIVRKIWGWVLVGVGIGAWIHNYVPQNAVETVVGGAGIFSVPIATILGVPMYGGCAAIVPVAVVLFQKGVPLGTALAFMMAVAALSLPEAVMLRRAMRLRLILVFFGVTALGIMIIGYLFNFLSGVLI